MNNIRFLKWDFILTGAILIFLGLLAYGHPSQYGWYGGGALQSVTESKIEGVVLWITGGYLIILAFIDYLRAKRK